jgi:hypothetical protein
VLTFALRSFIDDINAELEADADTNVHALHKVKQLVDDANANKCVKPQGHGHHLLARTAAHRLCMPGA